MAKRWKCPECGTGRLAPSRMAADDTRRFCLECSADSPRLVRMICPSLEAKREASRERSKLKAAAGREAERSKFLLGDGTDLRKLERKAKGLKVWKGEGDHVARAVKAARVDWVRRDQAGFSRGLAWASRVRITVFLSSTHDPTAELLIHELAHVARSRLRGGTNRDHDRAFHSLLLAAASEFFGVPEAPIIARWNALKAEDAEGRGWQKSHYLLDDAIRHELKARKEATE